MLQPSPRTYPLSAPRARPVDTAVWKYVMAAHFRGVHAGLGVPAEMGNISISDKEKLSLGVVVASGGALNPRK